MQPGRLLVAVVFLCSLPLVEAQAPSSSVRISIEPRHQVIVLSEQGEANGSFTITLVMNGANCVQEARMTMDLRLDPFPRFAGASIDPAEASWTVPPATPWYVGQSDHDVPIAWDVEAAPTNAVVTYQVQGGRPSLEGGPCTPSSTGIPQTTVATLTACLPPSKGGPAGENCDVQPDAVPTSSTIAEAPHVGPFGILVAVIAAAISLGSKNRGSGAYHKK